jgi:hypothetical protein
MSNPALMALREDFELGCTGEFYFDKALRSLCAVIWVFAAIHPVDRTASPVTNLFCCSQKATFLRLNGIAARLS